MLLIIKNMIVFTFLFIKNVANLLIKKPEKLRQIYVMTQPIKL